MGRVWYYFRCLFRLLQNCQRAVRRAPDYVTFVLEGDHPDLRLPKAKWWQRRLSPPKLSIEELGQRMEMAAADRRVRGVVLHLRNLALPMAGLQALRAMLAKVQARGKEVVVWAASLNTATYYVACQADRILLQPGGRIAPLGLSRPNLFLAKSLEHIGLQVDAVQISPYKSAADRFTRTNMSEEMRKMQNWLLDSQYNELVEAVSRGRNIGKAATETLLDNSPYTHQQAHQQGVVDGVHNEEELPAVLGSEGRPARLMPWNQAKTRLKLPPCRRPGGYIALLRIEGTIVDGKSARRPISAPPIPLLFSHRAGDLTVVSIARNVLRDPRAKGLLVYIDSGGGSATASEAMYSALAKVAAKKPVVALMGSVAASGGYYVAAPAHWIVAQPGTITGSIGVLTGKLVDAGLVGKLLMHRETLTRGANAGMEQSDAPFTREQKEKVWAYIKNTYDLFLERVASRRKLTIQAVDQVGGGRVWTGAQAKEHKLVDELGGLEQAVDKIRHLGNLGNLPVKEAFLPKPPLDYLETAPVGYALESIRLLQTCDALCICPLWLNS